MIIDELLDKLIWKFRFSAWSLRFMDAYRKRLDGRQAAWAAKKFRGHRVIPVTLLADLENLKALKFRTQSRPRALITKFSDILKYVYSTIYLTNISLL